MNVVVTVARKPLEASTVASNMLLHGTGAMGIDATRVGFASGEVDFTKVQRQQHSVGAVDGAFGAAALIGKEVMTYKPGGRWPSNCLFEHLPTCRKVGVRTEPGPPINRCTDGMKPFGEGAGHAFETVGTPPVGVDVWECRDGCPVAELDEQSGVTVAGAAGKSGASGFAVGYDGEYDVPYGDKGGASRYFKQFQKEQEP